MEQVKDRNRRIVITVAKKPHAGGGSLLGNPKVQERRIDEAEETARKLAMLASLQRFFQS